MNITIQQINKHFQDLSPFQAKKVTESYVGQKIKWRLHFFDLNNYNRLGGENVYMVHTSENDPHFSIFFEVDINKFPQFMSISRKESFEVIAKIESIKEYQITLSDIESIFFSSEIQESSIIKNIDSQEISSNFSVVNNIHNSQVNLNTSGLNKMKNNSKSDDKGWFTMNNPITAIIFTVTAGLILFYFFGIK